jgi:hypothetical protein
MRLPTEQLKFSVAASDLNCLSIAKLAHKVKVKAKYSFVRRSVGQYVLASAHHQGSVTNFSFSYIEIILRYLQLFLLSGTLSEEKIVL